MSAHILDPVAILTENIPAEQIHRYTIEEYEQMVASGALEDMRVELIDGYLLDMHAKSPPHEDAIRWLTDWLYARVDLTRHLIAVTGSLRIGNSEPEPDLMVSPRDKPKRQHPTSAHLVIEVAYSSRNRDLTLKPRLYSAVVPDYWVVDLDERVVVVHRDPIDGAYRTVLKHTAGDTLAPLLLPDEPMPFGELFDAA